MFKTLPTSFPSREADSVATAFIADIHGRVPTICGTAVKYSGKALTPLAMLQPAVGCTGEHTNLKPVELIPELDLNQFPIPPSMRISWPIVAALPNESASLGMHPYPSQHYVQNCSQTVLTQGAPWHANIMPTTANHSMVTGFFAHGTPLNSPSTFMHQPVHLHNGGMVITPAQSVLPKVVPQFGPTQGIALQQAQTPSELNTSKQTASILRDRASLTNLTNNSQPPAKKLRFNVPSQPFPQSQPTASIISQQGPDKSMDMSVHVPTLTGGIQNGLQQPQVHSSTQPRVVPEMGHVSVSSTVSRQIGSGSKSDHQEDRQSQVKVVQNPQTEKTRPQTQCKEPVQVDGVSDDIILKVRYHTCTFMVHIMNVLCVIWCLNVLCTLQAHYLET